MSGVLRHETAGLLSRPGARRGLVLTLVLVAATGAACVWGATPTGPGALRGAAPLPAAVLLTAGWVGLAALLIGTAVAGAADRHRHTELLLTWVPARGRIFLARLGAALGLSLLLGLAADLLALLVVTVLGAVGLPGATAVAPGDLVADPAGLGGLVLGTLVLALAAAALGLALTTLTRRPAVAPVTVLALVLAGGVLVTTAIPGRLLAAVDGSLPGTPSGSVLPTAAAATIPLLVVAVLLVLLAGAVFTRRRPA